MAGLAVVVAVLLGVAYFQAVRGGFLWDDDGHVTAPALRSWAGLWRIWFEMGATQQYYPLLHSAFWLEQRLWGDATMGYHIAVVAQHGVAAVLLFVLLRKLAVPGAFLAAVVFAVHPVHTESVAWISEQKNTLSLTLYLGAALGYFRFRSDRNAYFYALATFLFILALLTKTVTASLPAALLVVQWWRHGRVSWRDDVVPLVPWLLLGAGSGLLTAWVERKLIGAEGVEFELSVLQRLALAGRVVWFYTGKLLWPANLTFSYPRWTISVTDWLQWMPLATLLASFAFTWRWRDRSRAPAAVMMLFVGALAPVLGFLNVYPFRYSFVADHFQYLASVPIFAAVGALVDRGLPGARRRPTVAIVLPLWVLTTLQSGDYRSPEVLWRATLARNPGSSLALVHLGNILSTRGEHGEALVLFERAGELNPHDYDAPNNLGCELVRLGRFEEAERAFQRSLQLNPLSPETNNNYGYNLVQLGRIAEAIGYYERALQVRPSYSDAHNNLAVALCAAGRANEALSHFEAALQGLGDDPKVHHNFANALRQLGRLPEAIARYEHALRLAPALAETHDDLGLALAAAGRWDDALASYTRAMELKPELVDARVHAAEALAQIGRLREALAQLERDPDLLARRGDAALLRGMVLSRLERWQEAKDALLRAVDLDPRSGTAHRALAMVLANSGAVDASIQQFETAIRVEPTEAENYLGLARLLDALGRSREATELRLKASVLGTPQAQSPGK